METVKAIAEKVWDYTKYYTIETARDFKSVYVTYPNVIIWTIALTALITWIV
jgi:hypothetical protein